MTEERRLHCPCQGHLQASLTDGCECSDHVHDLDTYRWLLIHPEDVAALPQPATEPALDDVRAFIARVEGYQVGDFEVTLPSVEECDALLSRLAAQPSAEVERLRAALREFLEWFDTPFPTSNVELTAEVERLRAALATRTDQAAEAVRRLA